MGEKKKFKTKKGFIKGEKKMTENAIKYQSLQEEKRHNKEEESRKEKERKADVASKIGSGFGSGIGGLIGSINDPSWYNLDKQMVKDTALVSFNTPLGAETEFPSVREFIPGIMRLRLGHTVGDSAAANNAAKSIYAYIRQANSGSKNYEPNDIMAYILTMCDAYSFHAFMVRLYSLANTAKGENRYYFDAMIEACGGDPTVIRGEIAQLRAYINSYAQRLNAFYVPKEIPILKRRYWLYSNIFKDADIKKSQTYVFTPYALGVYNDTNSTLEAYPHGTSTNPFDTNMSLNSVAGIKFFGDVILNALLDSADIAIMSGDILKAYGEGNVHFIPSIDENFHIEAIYSPEVLSQIHNATIVGEFNPSNKADSRAVYDIVCPAGGYIRQGFSRSVGALPFIPVFLGECSVGLSAPGFDCEGIILNMYKDNPTPDDVMVATRLSVACGGRQSASSHTDNVALYRTGESTSRTPSNWYFPKPVNGTEVVVNATIYTFTSDTTYAGTDIGYSIFCSSLTDVYANLNSGKWNSVTRMRDIIKPLSKFDWAPIIYYISNITGSNGVITYTNMDAANTATVSYQTLTNMHYTAILSEYGVPMLGVKVRTR